MKHGKLAVLILILVVAVAVSSANAGSGSYTVHQGDTLSKIAMAHGTTVQALVELNRDRYPSLATAPERIEIGWKLRMPSPDVKAIQKKAESVLRQGIRVAATVIALPTETPTPPASYYRSHSLRKQPAKPQPVPAKPTPKPQPQRPKPTPKLQPVPAKPTPKPQPPRQAKPTPKPTRKPQPQFTEKQRRAAERQAWAEINRRRKAEGHPALAWDDHLASIARGRAEDMIRRNYFSHDDPSTGKKAISSQYGEVIFEIGAAVPYSRVADHAVAWWWKSPGHHHGLTMPVHKLGIGLACATSYCIAVGVTSY